MKFTTIGNTRCFLHIYKNTQYSTVSYFWNLSKSLPSFTNHTLAKQSKHSLPDSTPFAMVEVVAGLTLASSREAPVNCLGWLTSVLTLSVLLGSRLTLEVVDNDAPTRTTKGSRGCSICKSTNSTFFETPCSYKILLNRIQISMAQFESLAKIYITLLVIRTCIKEFNLMVWFIFAAIVSSQP